MMPLGTNTAAGLPSSSATSCSSSATSPPSPYVSLSSSAAASANCRSQSEVAVLGRHNHRVDPAAAALRRVRRSSEAVKVGGVATPASSPSEQVISAGGSPRDDKVV